MSSFLNRKGSATLVAMTAVAGVSLMVAMSIVRATSMAKMNRGPAAQKDTQELMRAVDLLLQDRCMTAIQWYLPPPLDILTHHFSLYGLNPPEAELELVSQTGVPLARKGLVSNSVLIESVRLEERKPIEHVPYCYESRLQIDVNRGDNLGKKRETLFFPLTIRTAGSMDEESRRKAGLPKNQIIHCHTGRTSCLPPPPPPPPPVWSYSEEETANCTAPSIHEFKTSPDPLPMGQALTLSWKVSCANRVKIAVKDDFEAEVPIGEPFTLKVSPTQGGVSEVVVATLTAILDGKGSKRISRIVVPGSCGLQGEDCADGRYCCTGYCSLRTNQCSDPCTANMDQKVTQSSCVTDSPIHETCGLTAADGDYLAQGQVLDLENGTYAVTWFACNRH